MQYKDYDALFFKSKLKFYINWVISTKNNQVENFKFNILKQLFLFITPKQEKNRTKIIKSCR